jgi:hypothetical protein
MNEALKPYTDAHTRTIEGAEALVLMAGASPELARDVFSYLESAYLGRLKIVHDAQQAALPESQRKPFEERLAEIVVAIKAGKEGSG